LHGTGFTLDWIYNVNISEAQAGIEKILLYPNPASEKIKIQIETIQPETLQITLYDIVGRALKTFTLEAAQQTIQTMDVSNLAKGIYMLQVVTSKGQVMRKVVIQ